VAIAPVVVTPSVSVEETMLNQSGVIAVTSNVVGTVYVVEVSVKVAKVSDIENTGSYLWVSAPITNVGVNEVSVDIDAIINGNYRVYVANDKGVLSAASLNMVVVSMSRLYDSVAAQGWGSQFGPINSYSNIRVTVDASGNVYVVSTVRIDSDRNLLVKKFDSSGNEISSINLGTTAADFASSIAVDGSGNVYVAGETYGAFEGFTNPGGSGGFVSKFNSSLVLQDLIQFGTTGYDYVSSIAVDGSGNVYVGGFTGGAFEGFTNPGGLDGFVSKFNSSLVLQDLIQFGTSGEDIASSIAVDGSGNVYVAGETYGAFEGFTNPGGLDGFVSKFNSSLVLQDLIQFGTTGDDYVSSIAVDGSGNVYVAGFTEGAFEGFTNPGGIDGFVSKFNSSLVLQDLIQFGTTGEDVASSIAVDGSGNVYVAGYTEGAFLSSTNQGEVDAVVLMFDSSFELKAFNQFGTTGDDAIYSMFVDGSGNVYVTGLTKGELFEPNSGGDDAFVLKIVDLLVGQV
jgi:hypothetical protein